MSYQLNEKTVGQIVDTALTLFRENFLTLLAVQLVFVGIPWAVLVGMFAVSGSDSGLVIGSIVFAIAYSVGWLMATAATVRIVSLAYLNKEASFGDATAHAWGRIGPLFVSGLAKWIIAWLAMFLLIVPGIIAMLGYSAVTQVIVLEKPERSTSALKRSWELTKGYKGRVLVVGFVAAMLMYVPSMFFGVLAVFFPSLLAVLNAMGFVVGLAVAPVLFAAMTIHYYDLRVRKEAFDLEVLGEALND